MVATIDDAKLKFESEGLYVSRRPDRLWIAVNLRDVGEGIKMADDACALIKNDDRWLAIFPAEGQCTYEMRGTLPDMVAMISAVNAEHRRAGVPFKDAFRHVVTDPDQYAIGRSVAHV